MPGNQPDQSSGFSLKIEFLCRARIAVFATCLLSLGKNHASNNLDPPQRCAREGREQNPNNRLIFVEEARGEKSWHFGHVPLRLKSIRWQEVVQFTLNLHWQTLSCIFYNFLLREIRNIVIRVQPSTILGGVLLCKGCHKLHRFGADQSQVLLTWSMTIK